MISSCRVPMAARFGNIPSCHRSNMVTLNTSLPLEYNRIEQLSSLTKVTNKHLLPVYNKPMIYYPLQTLVDMGINEVMIVSGKGHAGHFLELLGSGSDFGITISYAVQEEAGGIAQALGLCKDFSDGGPVCVILGDNIFDEKFDISSYTEGAHIFLKEVENAKRFGVATLDNNNNVIKIVEKPKVPETNHAVTGLYIYDKDVFDIIKKLKPSKRNELEITDVNNEYIKKGRMKATIVQSNWTDAGTFESLFRASSMMREREKQR